ncbi:Lsr2 dimerization domain-containing protein [Arthrobacter castelli]|uniref:Lsr2 dimerization domain-containing protein n=1 Tax=Arthrobacter castelli TaxID=271431 RepID=UPI0003FD44D6|nr:histone-like nucleoid-structuring protein Lsr2 [Arthrobacter castelli]
MATRHIIESDISGKTDAATITFGLGDDWYEVDLTPDEQEQLKAYLDTYVTVARKAEEKQAKPRQVPETSVEERAAIRAWAKKKGYEDKGYGRIPKKIMAAYRAEHGLASDKKND